MAASLAAFLAAVSSILSKIVLNAGVSPADLVGARTVIAFVLLFTLVAGVAPRLIRIPPEALLYFAIYGILGLAAVNLSINWSLKLNPVSVAVLLLYTSPLFILIWSALSKTVAVRGYEVLTTLVLLLGVGLVARAYDPPSLRVHGVGLLLGVCSALAYAFSTIWGKHGVGRFHPVTVLLYGLGFAAGFWVLVGAPWRFAVAGHPSWIWGTVLALAILLSVCTIGLVLLALRAISSAETSLTASIEPLFTMGLAYGLLAERLEPSQLLGVGLLIAGVTYLQVKGVRSHGGPLTQSGRLAHPETPPVEPTYGDGPARTRRP